MHYDRSIHSCRMPARLQRRLVWQHVLPPLLSKHGGIRWLGVQLPGGAEQQMPNPHQDWHQEALTPQAGYRQRGWGEHAPVARCRPQGSMSKSRRWLVVPLLRCMAYSTCPLLRTSQHRMRGSWRAPLYRKLPSGDHITWSRTGTPAFGPLPAALRNKLGTMTEVCHHCWQRMQRAAELGAGLSRTSQLRSQWPVVWQLSTRTEIFSVSTAHTKISLVITKPTVSSSERTVRILT